MSTTTQQKKISELEPLNGEKLSFDDLMIISKHDGFEDTYKSHKITTNDLKKFITEDVMINVQLSVDDLDGKITDLANRKFIKTINSIGSDINGNVNINPLLSTYIERDELNPYATTTNVEKIVDGKIIESTSPIYNQLNDKIDISAKNDIIDSSQPNKLPTNQAVIDYVKENAITADIDNGGSGGVIDGTLLNDLVEIPFNDVISEAGKRYDVYTTMNDCLLYVGYENNIAGGNSIYFFINDNLIFATTTSNATTSSTPDKSERNGCTVPVKKGTTIQVACSITSTPSEQTVLQFIEYKLHGINSSPSYGSGGVIDGTILKETSSVTLNLSNGVFQDAYTTTNDCYLIIETETTIDGVNHGLGVYIGDTRIDGFGVYTDDGSADSCINIPVKANTKIRVKPHDFTKNAFTLKFTELKLVDTNPQVAFPDWDESKKESITKNDWIANKDGWILFESINSYDTKIMINGITVGRLGQYDFVGYGIEIIPITAGDKLTYSGDTNNIIGTNFTLDFYPVKAVAQPQCVSYVVETGRFSSVDGTTHPNNSENDSWYRLYSDGWCEQGGTTIDDHNIKFYKSYVDNSYSVLALSNGSNYTRFNDKTNNGVQIINGVSGSDSISWETKGYV